LTQAFEESYKIFSHHVNEQEVNLTDDAGKQKVFRHLDWIPWSYEMWRATDKFDSTYDTLWDLRLIFSDIYPWSLIWRVRDEIRQTTDNAVYTYEKRLEQEGANPEASKRVLASVMDDFVHDGKLTTRNLIEELLKLIIMPPFNSLMRPACKAVLEPLQSLIPDAMKDFVDIYKMFDKVLDGVIHDSIVVCIDGNRAIQDDRIDEDVGKGKEKMVIEIA